MWVLALQSLHPSTLLERVLYTWLCAFLLYHGILKREDVILLSWAPTPLVCMRNSVFVEEDLCSLKKFQAWLMPFTSSLYVCDCPLLRQVASRGYLWYMLRYHQSIAWILPQVYHTPLLYGTASPISPYWNDICTRFTGISVCTAAMHTCIIEVSVVGYIKGLRHYIMCNNFMCYNPGKWLPMFVQYWKPQLSLSRIGKVRTFW